MTGALPSRSALLGVLIALSTTLLLAFFWAAGGATLTDVAWLSGAGSRLHLALDPLSAPLVLFATGVAIPILWYAGGYLPEYLSKRGRGQSEQARFFGLMVAFMGAMVLLLLAQDLLLIFVALELTALASFLLIEFDRNDPEARRAASVALIVTVASSLLFLIGVLSIGATLGATTIPALRELATEPVPASIGVCLVFGLVGKSAQVPLHFWLPRAMVAPTPVSAYLHSAALVAAGVFVLLRVRFLLAPGILDLLQLIGFASILTGGLLALVTDELKRILAYSTVAQYGYIVVLIALGGDEGLAGAPFAIVAHGLAKSALFLTAGAVTSTTGAERLSETRPRALRRRMPLLALASALAAAALAGLPVTIGYFKDDLLIGAALHRGPLSTVLAALAVAMTLAYIGRFWLGLFAGGTSQIRARAPGAMLLAPVIALAVLAVIGGLWTAPLADAFRAAGEEVGGRPLSFELHYRLEAKTWIAIVAWAAGAALLAVRDRWEPHLERVTSLTTRYLGPARLFARAASLSVAASNALHRFEVRDLRDRVSAVIVPSAAFVALGLLGGAEVPYSVGAVDPVDLPAAGALVLTAGATILSVLPVKNIALIVLLSFVGFSLALTFAISRAPNVALVLVIIETTLTILFLALLWGLRARLITKAEERETERRGPWTGIIAGAAAFVLAWTALSAKDVDTVASEQIRLAGAAHAHDVVTAILTDFRGLDTAVELTVLAVAVFGSVAISWGRDQ